jgi:hypothetical protein
MANSEHWLGVWRGLALGLLRDGYCSTDAVIEWARKNKFPLYVVKAAFDALAVERFHHNGEQYCRLSGKVVPILPRDVPNAVTYRRGRGMTKPLFDDAFKIEDPLARA